MDKNMDVATATCLWWTFFGACFFVSGLILMALAYTTLQVLTTVPTSSVSSVPSSFSAQSAQVLDIGFVSAVFGLIVMIWGKFRLSVLGLQVVKTERGRGKGRDSDEE